MPNRIALQSLSSLQKLSHDPTVTINGDPLGILGDDPFAEMTETIIFGAINSFLEMLKDVTGIDLTTYATVLEGLPFDLLTSVLQGQGNWTALLSGAGVPNVEGLLSLLLNPIAVIQSFIPDWIPVSSIVDAAMNLLPDGLFGASTSVPSDGPWDWTSLFKMGQSAGSAVATHDGSLQQLFSDPPTKVKVGQAINLSQGVKWSSVGSPTGNVFQLGVQLFDAAMAPIGGVTQLASIANPVSNSTSAPGADGQGFVLLNPSTYTVPAGTSFLSQVLTVNPVAALGQSFWSNGSLSRNALMPQSLVQDLPAQIASILAQAQATIDNIVQSMFGGVLTGYTLPDLKQALSQIPGFNVLGASGIPTMDGTITTMWDSVTSALKQFGLTGVSLSDFAGAAQDTSYSATSAEQLAIIQQNILGTRTNNPVSGGLERTTVTNVAMTELGTAATPSSVPVTQAVSAIGILRMAVADTKGVAYFKAIMSGTVSGFYLNFGKMALDGSVTPLFSSGNLAASLTTAWAWLTYTFPGASQISHNASENIVVEYQVVGSGTVNVQGLAQTHQTDHPAATTKRTAATRNTGASGPTSLSIAAGSVAFSGNTPKVDLGRADVPANYVPPEITIFNNSGTWTRPTWLVAGDLIDVLEEAGGGGGAAGGYGIPNQGGESGQGRTQSYVYSSDPRGTGLPVWPTGTTTATITIGSGGSPGINPFTLDPGNPGGNTSLAATGVTTFTATGGRGGGRSGNGQGQSGQAAPTLTLNGYIMFGGPAAGTNNAGNPPGGGGGSGYPATGQSGAKGQLRIRAHQYGT